MFRIKVCGVTSPRDALVAAELGADAVGINFWPGSARFVPFEKALPIVRAVRGRALVVGVFVNERPATIERICAELGIGTVQLAGDEPAEAARAIRLFRIRSMRPGAGGGTEPAAAYPCEAILLDARAPGRYGGTGIPVDWGWAAEAIASFRRDPAGTRMCALAGGLSPENVGRAIRTARPDAVDVASGVESTPGVKDPSKLEAFIRNARKEFARGAA